MTESGQYHVGREPFRVGVAYWPRRAQLGLWKDFDIDEVHEDFAILSELGINLARVALLWEDFQPEPDSVRCSALAHLLGLCDAAASEDVRLELLLFAGNVGNAEGFPDWLRERDSSEATTDGNGRSGLVNPFESALVRRAAAVQVRAIARTVGTHPAIWAYNLGDRLDRLARRRCRIAARNWFDELSTVIHAVDSKHPVTCSLGASNLSSDGPCRVDQVFSVLDHSTIDREGLAGDLGQLDIESQAVFSCALTLALTGKPCLLQDSWDSTSPTTRQTTPELARSQAFSVRSLLEDLHRVGALGAVIGFFTDLVMPKDGDHGSGGIGLLKSDGQMRPHCEAIQAFAKGKRAVQKPALKSMNLGVTADEFYEQPGAHLRRLQGEFFAG